MSKASDVLVSINSFEDKVDPKDYDRNRSQNLFCLVFPTEQNGKSNDEVEENRQLICDRIVEAGLSVELFFSVQEDEVYCKVGATDSRLLLEADATKYKLRLDPGNLKVVAEGNEDEERGPIHLEPPYDRSNQKFSRKSGKSDWIDMTDEEILPFIQRQTDLSPFEHIYARYNDEWEQYSYDTYGVEIYAVQPDGSILRNVDRMKLVKRILERSTKKHPVSQVRGAGLDLQRLVYDKTLLGQFFIQTAQTAHNAKELTVEKLYSKWKSSACLPWRQPMEDIRNYFGERIAFYFAFLGHYTFWLTVPALLGFAIFVHQLLQVYSADGRSFLQPSVYEEIKDGNETTYEANVFTEVPESSFFGLFMALWATFLMEFWKRKQSRYSLKWGMVDYEKREFARVEFSPTHFLPSPVTGKAESYYSEWSFLFKISGSMVVLMCCIVVVLAAIAGILILKVVATKLPQDGSIPLVDETIAPKIALAVNAVVIQILAFFYRTIARKLNDWENHRTDTEYEDSLIAKSFVFNFVNSYATLAYIAFVKSGTVIDGVAQFCIPQTKAGVDISEIVEFENVTIVDACFGGLGYSLLIIFATQLVVNNTVELFLPAILAWWSKRQNLKGVQAKEESIRKSNAEGDEDSSRRLSRQLKRIKTKSPIEEQFFLKEYEGTFNDFLEIALQFGYVTLFVVAFPLAPALALLNNFIEVRVDSFKLCKLSRRPEMQGAQDIGSWYKVFAVISNIAVISNAAVICFTSSSLIPKDDTLGVSYETTRVWYFIVFVATVLIIKWFVGALIDDVPKSVKLQIKRNEFLVRKCLVRERDDDKSGEGQQHVAERHSYVVNNCDPTIDRLLHVLATSIKEANIGADLETMFGEADVNNNGAISVQEFATVLNKVGGVADQLSPSDIEMLVHALDNNGNGQIDYNEFATFISG